jgi:hypothetical protein
MQTNPCKEINITTDLEIIVLNNPDDYGYRGYYTKGHHDLEKFLKRVNHDYGESLTVAKHCYGRCVPARDEDGKHNPGRFMFITTDKPGRGAFPCTYAER